MLTMRLFRTRVEFEWDDQEVNSTVTISDQDDQDAVIRKLKRVIALVEGAQAPGLAGMAKALADFGAHAKADAVTGGLPPQTGNGWAAYAAPVVAPELPEDRKGDWEMIPPEEQE